MTKIEILTPHGPARAELHCAEEDAAVLMLGHGAGGGIEAKDLVAVTRAAQTAGVNVALVEQPYRVAGRRAPAPAKQLDAAWLAVAEEMTDRFDGLPLVFGGRSSGARVACRTAAAGQAVAVLCLAFPEHPPGKPEKSRQAELDAVEVPTLVVQGESDPFGRPRPGPHHEVVVIAGTHALDKDLDGLSRAVTEWLGRVLRPLT
ncbi:alpha/beta hydrolase [Amycolatopsis sp. K13G38]|uniref:Alpha/beta hydrolase n=1 Tax=Amycolatopsis acididurans TaxID=2724524 RepID=A0ABX1JJZ3_9PSEU|nr:alpha/beta family hydrolase [Amycolatopsis acididurans]NKQ59154.1 alpha/beta hydrolase [Amycolatopsis acididurans]